MSVHQLPISGHEDLQRLLAALERALAEIPDQEIPSLIGHLEGLKASAWTRMMNGNGQPPQAPESDRLLTAEETAPLLGTTPRWLYRHHRQLPFARRLSRKCLRFSEAGIRKWMATKRA